MNLCLIPLYDWKVFRRLLQCRYNRTGLGYYLAGFYSLNWLRSADSHHFLNVVGRRAKYWSTQ